MSVDDAMAKQIVKAEENFILIYCANCGDLLAKHLTLGNFFIVEASYHYLVYSFDAWREVDGVVSGFIHASLFIVKSFMSS